MTHRKNTPYVAVLIAGLSIGLLISILVLALQVQDWSVYSRFWSALADMRYILGVGSAGLLLLMWLFVTPRVSIAWKRSVALALVACVTIAVATLRIEGFTGQLRPRLAWRWTPSAEKAFSQYERSVQQDSTEHSDAPVDLTTTSPTDYPGFLGRDRTGIAYPTTLERDWEAHPPKLLWSHPVGAGWSSFAVVGNFAVTQEQREEFECVVCYELLTGIERWVHKDNARFDRPGAHGAGPRATPTIHNGMVFTMGATGILNCLDGSTGNVRWQHHAFVDEATQNLAWGMAGSPLIVDSTVVVSPGGGGGRSIQAYDIDSGRQAWAASDAPTAYASLQLATLSGVRQLLWFNGQGLCGLDATNGQQLWSYPWVTQGDQMVNVAQPLVLAQFGYQPEEPLVLISSGYDKGCALLHIQFASSGWEVTAKWENRNLKSKFSNMSVVGEDLYGLDNGILACLDLANGKKNWKKGRFGHGQLLLVGAVLLIQSESGEIHILKPKDALSIELGHFAALPTKSWCHPVTNGDVLLTRNDRVAACYAISESLRVPVLSQ